MSFETQKNFLGKTQTIRKAEMRSERWISLIRLAIAGFYSTIVIFGFLLGNITLKAFTVQAIALGIVLSYSSYFLFKSSNRLLREYFIYVLVLCDNVVITAIIWSYYLNGAPFNLVTSSISGAYFIVIVFTALHHRASLSLFCGGLSAIGYSIVYFLYTQGSSVPIDMTNDYPVRIAFILTVSALGAIASRNNSQSMQQVISSENRYHNLVHRLPEMLFTLDLHGNFIWSNTASHAILGIPSKVLAGRSIRSFLIQPDTLKLDAQGIKGTFGIRDFNSEKKFIDCIIQPVLEGDRRVAFDGIISDVTDREMAISQREEMVQRLFQYQKMESLGTLASGMAHDFNNILQTVNDLSTMIMRESKEDETRKRVELINETMADARFLIQELFALGRKKPLDYRHINVNNLLAQVAPHFGKQLGPNYSVILETPDEPFWIQGDPEYLKRIFQNLFGNARDAMPEGGTITITSKAVHCAGNDTVIQIRISDSGTGIPQELTEKVFDPFFTTKKPGKGTGLGLALARRIVMLHNGTISIERSGYEGTVFLIVLPMSDEADLKSDTKAFMMNRMHTSVLLLDDDAKIRDVLKIFLREFKYSVLEATNGDEAADLLKRNTERCNVLVMDWKLGNENPHHVIRNLRALKNDLIVIVVSGYSPEEKSIAAMQIERWFTKPYDRNQLDVEIQRALHRKQDKCI